MKRLVCLYITVGQGICHAGCMYRGALNFSKEIPNYIAERTVFAFHGLRTVAHPENFDLIV